MSPQQILLQKNTQNHSSYRAFISPSINKIKETQIMEKTFHSSNSFECSGLLIETGVNSMNKASITVLIRNPGKEPKPVEFTLMHPLSGDIRRRDHVKVKGHIRSYSRYNSVREKNVQIQTFMADSVEKAVPHITRTLGLKAQHCDNSEFSADIVGTVVRIIETSHPDWAKLIVRTDSMEDVDKRPSFIEISYHKSRHLRPFDYVPGDNVAIWASLRIQEKTLKDGSEVVFRNLVVEDIVLLDANGERMETRPEQAKKEEPAAVPSEIEIDLPDEEEA